jgi:hypothetical protein
VGNDQKPTERMVLTEVMKPMADALDDWALVREKVLERIDLQAAAEARSLSREIRACLERIDAVESVRDGESETKKLQQLRSSALELLARHK